jgi:GntR family transcriptional repressor for pyruvate dehydrogenase complex
VMEPKKFKQQTIVQQVMDEVKNMIASGQLKPGDKIPTETELSQMFGIGMSTVREAIKIFQYLGILNSSTRKGTFVCDYSNISVEAITWSILLRTNEIFELVELRDIIEARAVAVLAKKVRSDPEGTKSIIRELENQISRMSEALDRYSMDDLSDADYEFHRIMVESCNNGVFSSIYATLRSFMREEIRKTNVLEAARSRGFAEHKMILDSIRTGDPIAAAKAFQEHIEGIRDQLRQSLELSSEQ